MVNEIPFTEIAVVIAGHGSTLSAQSSRATRALVERLNEMAIFAEVHATFWKEEPYFCEVFEQINCEHVWVVPHFISEGYFTQQVIPRELGLTGAITVRDGFCIRYCEPVGSHAGMTDLLLSRAIAAAGESEPSETSLMLVGHGTDKDEGSARAVRYQVGEMTRRSERFAEVVGLYLDQAPHLSEWQELSHARNVVVLPFFIAEGLHFTRDLPKILGLEPGFEQRFYEVGQRRVFCTTAVGGDPAMVDFVIDQIKNFEER
ncbi:MAG: hypothetical protein L3J39_17855 [Verrucomicrobiales bacterium]|nr:hypothetical protein [Verrucomicrobiales bacterium]